MTAAEIGREEDAELKSGGQDVQTTGCGIYHVQKQGEKTEKRERRRRRRRARTGKWVEQCLICGEWAIKESLSKLRGNPTGVQHGNSSESAAAELRSS